MAHVVRGLALGLAVGMLAVAVAAGGPASPNVIAQVVALVFALAVDTTVARGAALVLVAFAACWSFLAIIFRAMAENIEMHPDEGGTRGHRVRGSQYWAESWARRAVGARLHEALELRLRADEGE